MSAFRVGQRVRVAWVRLPANRRLVGLEGAITEISFGIGSPVIYGLDVSPIEVVDGIRYGFDPAQLEPLLPPDIDALLAMTGADFTLRAPVSA